MIIIMAKVLQQQFDCPLVADFTDTDVPVTIAFNGVTQNNGTQTFCYTVTQVEEPTALSHFVLGICPNITEEDLVSVTVTINGEEQTVIIGDNVEIFNPPDTDPVTDCPGIKFDFGLEEAGDVMVVCFEVMGNFEVGPVEACITGGGFVGTGRFVCGPVCGEVEICETTVFQTLDVCVPITITPETIVGPINVRCCRPAMVSLTPCPMEGEPNCVFFVRQRLCAEVPIRFSALGEDGPPVVNCDEPNLEECEDCPTNGDAGI
jgi:hypothetical protein